VRSLAKLGQKFGHFHSGTIAFSRSGISCITVDGVAVAAGARRDQKEGQG
jgi:hypothetical protein